MTHQHGKAAHYLPEMALPISPLGMFGLICNTGIHDVMKHKGY